MKGSLDARLLRVLREAQGAVLPSLLAAQLGISGEELQGRLVGLRDAGFDLPVHPILGCSLAGTPDRLIADDLWSRFSEGGAGFLREILVLEEAGSTNDLASQLGRGGAPGGMLVLAERQTAGRGRLGRAWASALHRGLWMSLLLRPELPMEQWPRLTTWVAVSLAIALERATGVRTQIKWPNDLQVQGKKVAGILVEVGTDSQPQPFAVVGVGLNVNQEAEEFPPELREIATSLRLATGAAMDRPAVLVALLEELHAHLRALESDFGSLVVETTRRSSVLGNWVQARSGQTVLEGLAESLDAEGHLMVRTGGGELVRLVGGEVSLRREVS